MTIVPTYDAAPPRVAFAVGRRVGNAVVRNRVRRRLRALAREHAAGFAPGHAYLVAATFGADSATYRDLTDALRGLLSREAGP
jgi:ribonuclease P protein component